MKIKLLGSSNIFQFPNFDYGKNEIEKNIDEKIKILKEKDPVDWTLIFVLSFSKAECIAVVKSGRTYPSTKEREITIIIPVPSINHAVYGLNDDKFARRPALDSTKFWTIPFDYDQYTNMRDLTVLHKGLMKRCPAESLCMGQKLYYLDRFRSLM